MSHTTSIATTFPVHGGVVFADALTLSTNDRPCDDGSITLTVPPLGGRDVATMLDESGSAIVEVLRAIIAAPGGAVSLGAAGHKDGRLAIVGRRRDGQSYSVTPGGGVEPGETSAEAAVREVREELGIACTLREPAALRLEFPGSVQLFYEATTTDEDLSLGGPAADRQSTDNAYEPRWADPLSIHDLRLDDVATYVRAHALGDRDSRSVAVYKRACCPR